MYGIPDRLRPLSAAEEQVLLAVWSCKQPASRRDIGEMLAAKGWRPATVLNFLYRLEDKGWVKSGKEQNRNTYTPTLTKRAYGVWTMRQRLDAVFGGDLVHLRNELLGVGVQKLHRKRLLLLLAHRSKNALDDLLRQLRRCADGLADQGIDIFALGQNANEVGEKVVKRLCIIKITYLHG